MKFSTLAVGLDKRRGGGETLPLPWDSGEAAALVRKLRGAGPDGRTEASDSRQQVGGTQISPSAPNARGWLRAG